MKMTTPVISKSSEQKMSFVMPSTYWNDISSAPAPVNDIVKLENKYLGDESFAVAWFGGYANKDTVDRKTKELISVIEKDEKWQVKGTPEPLLLQYNGTSLLSSSSSSSILLSFYSLIDPFQPPWKRRNEILIKVDGSI